MEYKEQTAIDQIICQELQLRRAGKTYAEIADLLHEPIGTVRSRLHRATIELNEVHPQPITNQPITTTLPIHVPTKIPKHKLKHKLKDRNGKRLFRYVEDHRPISHVKIHRPSRLLGYNEVDLGSNYTTDEIEFQITMDHYKRKRNRPFPKLSEILEVLKSLGWRKVADKSPLPKSPSSITR